HVVRGFSAGGVDYVTKPVVLDELYARIRVHLANARAAQSARIALDAVGRSLLTTDEKGLLLWCTPQASSLLTSLGGDASPGAEASPSILAAKIRDMVGREQQGSVKLSLTGQEIELFYLGGAPGGEHYFRIAQLAPEREPEVLRNALGLTAREADVLLWVSRGKSNRDASLILNISPRTVNKHLEQIFEKLGVENRAAAAVVAARIIAACS
ncbi:MAG: LuxR C-terminal-related transcriptional regulator, partial [Microvirga sp.]